MFFFNFIKSHRAFNPSFYIFFFFFALRSVKFELTLGIGKNCYWSKPNNK